MLVGRLDVAVSVRALRHSDGRGDRKGLEIVLWAGSTPSTDGDERDGDPGSLLSKRARCVLRDATCISVSYHQTVNSCLRIGGKIPTDIPSLERSTSKAVCTGGSPSAAFARRRRARPASREIGFGADPAALAAHRPAQALGEAEGPASASRRHGSAAASRPARAPSREARSAGRPPSCGCRRSPRR